MNDVKVKGAHAWQLNLPLLDELVDDDASEIETVEEVLTE